MTVPGSNVVSPVSPLDRPCSMRPISPVEVVNQLVAARKQALGTSQAEAQSRFRAAQERRLQDIGKTKAVKHLVTQTLAALNTIKSLESQMAVLGVRVDSGGNLAFTWEATRREEAKITPVNRKDRLDQLAQLKAQALADLIGLNVAQTRKYLRGFQKKLAAV